ncbi:hypothetical protein M011DRAFT_473652 [Sporormia fimetaria CBS 119925]|uniref:Uncharacterized protein n=1 Tax=Sporormia fimetaria CBS 119925 TaxID=1340428 RepID=A0A6A6VKK4_9PLEO|nr:hypothetical protein M011DRAFT_473652 [Sporormia fimetaria CBS 119925]
MAGYGNINAPTTDPASLAEDHNNTRLDIHHHSEPSYAGGPGFGNKNAPTPSDIKDDDLKLSTTPSKHPSMPSIGAGYGNKTGEFRESHDSTLGKIVEKAGHALHNANLEHKGRHMREEKGFGHGEGSYVD